MHFKFKLNIQTRNLAIKSNLAQIKVDPLKILYDGIQDFEILKSLKMSFIAQLMNEKILVIDCEVSEWSEWTKCSVNCGIGSSERRREILKPESNGGNECPILEEKRSCQTAKCNVKPMEKNSTVKGELFFYFNKNLNDQVYSSFLDK
jgi:hypothetical protein